MAASVASLESVESNNDYSNQLWERTEDEQTVNEAILLFLCAVAINTRGRRCGWSSTRLGFKIQYHLAKIETRTDGYLGLCGHDKNEEAFAILEAKAQCRSRKTAGIPIYKQESAEMVNWIMHDEKTPRQVPSGKRRLFIAQDTTKIFVIEADYDDSYVDYLSGPPSNPSFMTMQEYGPLKTTSSRHMKNA